MSSGTYNRAILVDNDQIVTVYISMDELVSAESDKLTLISYTTDTDSFNPNITNPSTQVELTLKHCIYATEHGSGNNHSHLTITYATPASTVDEQIIIIPSQASEISFNRGIGKEVINNNTKPFTGNINFHTNGKALSGYAVLTFYKKSGFLRNSKKYRKATQANPYSN
jgi:hypothetical protein